MQNFDGWYLSWSVINSITNLDVGVSKLLLYFTYFLTFLNVNITWSNIWLCNESHTISNRPLVPSYDPPSILSRQATATGHDSTEMRPLYPYPPPLGHHQMTRTLSQNTGELLNLDFILPKQAELSVQMQTSMCPPTCFALRCWSLTANCEERMLTRACYWPGRHASISPTSALQIQCLSTSKRQSQSHAPNAFVSRLQKRGACSRGSAFAVPASNPSAQSSMRVYFVSFADQLL